MAAVAAGAARADLLTFQPEPANLYDLPHQYYITWGIDLGAEDPSTVCASAAVLTFKNIYNWDYNDNVLYVRLLDQAPLGVASWWDNEGGGNNFRGQGVRLVTYRDLPGPGHPQTLTYTFNADQLAALNGYIHNDGRFALGFDPDCHFYNDGVSLDVVTCSSVVPEPAGVILMGLGLAGLALRRRRSR